MTHHQSPGTRWVTVRPMATDRPEATGGVGPHFVGDKIDKISKLHLNVPTPTQERRGFIHVKSFVRSAVRSHGEGNHGARAHRDSDDEYRIFSSAWVTDTKGKSAALFPCGECPAEFFK